MECYGYQSPSTWKVSSSTFLFPQKTFPSSPNNCLPLANQFRTRTRFGSVRVRATATDGFAKPGSGIDNTSLYELLGIPKTVSLVEIKRAYKQLVRKYHPDVSPPGRVHEYTEQFIRVHKAYETLSDPSKRALYDGTMPPFHPQERVGKSHWRFHWEDQISELKKRSMYKSQKSSSI